MLGLCGVVYIVVGIFIIVEVAARKELVQALYGLPIGVIIAWLLFRAVTKTKVPPKQLRPFPPTECGPPPKYLQRNQRENFGFRGY
jgi:hypothetical protein